MAIIYLTPQDLTASQTAAVLDFLNSVQSAGEIASRIEILGEPDVGTGVGQRILDFRRQLAGGFTDLGQLLAVPQVGPERFTEIVSVITGISLPQYQPANVDTLIRQAVADQLRALQPVPASAATGYPYRISIAPPATTPWVGQEVSLVVTVSDASGARAVPNLAVTFESGEMWLGTQFGYDVRQGQVVHTRTGSDGSIRLRLRNLFDEQLNPDQQVALVDALRLLNSAAAAPRDIIDQFRGLAERYENPVNKHLRAAVDIIYRSRSKAIADAINRRDNLYQWCFQSGLLRIYLDTDPGVLEPPMAVADATAGQVGVFRVAWKEWLPPWYDLYLAWLSDSDLQQSFVRAKEGQVSEAGVTAAILGHAYSFVARQNGVVGEALGRKVIGREIQHFLAREAGVLSAETRASMFPSLRLASSSISTADTGTLAVVNQSRAEVETIIDQRVGRDPLDLEELRGDFGLLSSRVEQLDGSVRQATDRLSRIDTDVSRIATDVARINTDVSRIDTDVSRMNTDISRIDTDVSRIDTDVSRINTDMLRIDTDVSRIDADVSRIDTSVSRVATDISRINSDVLRIATDLSRIVTDVSRIDADVSRIDTDVSRIDTDVSRIDTGLGRIEGGVRSLDEQFAGLNRSVTSLSATLTTLDTSVSSLNRNAVLKSDISRDARGRLIDINPIGRG